MNKEEAIQEVNFIKRILDETGREIVKSGSAFIWVGLVVYVSMVLFQYASNILMHRFNKWGLGIGLTMISVLIIEVIVGLVIYNRTVSRWSSATLEKQIWQIWTWALLITLLVFGVLIQRTDRSLSVGLTTVSPDNMNVAILVALVATGVLINKGYFYKLTVCCIVLNWVLRCLPETWRQLSYISGIVNLLIPLWGTGIYFLWQKRKMLAKGNSDGFEQSA